MFLGVIGGIIMDANTTLTEQDMALMERVVNYTNPKNNGRFGFTERDVTELEKLLFNRQVGRTIGEATLGVLRDVQGPAVVDGLGEHYSGQIGVFCADLYNGRQKAYFFFSAMYEIMKREKAKQTLH